MVKDTTTKAVIIYKDGSGAQCGRYAKVNGLCRQHHEIQAIGDYCLDCQQVFNDLAPWRWTKSKWLHENGTESQGKKHKVILVGIG